MCTVFKIYLLLKFELFSFRFIFSILVLNLFLSYVGTKPRDVKKICTTVSYTEPYRRKMRTGKVVTKKVCFTRGQAVKARRKTCFLRPDTGPCRADILQWYFDVRQGTCYRFFWGGCQGNGNKFETKKQCLDHCWLNKTVADNDESRPFFCSMTFDYGTCFGHYFRWAFDSFSRSCKRRLYSGCGGNQNNFQTQFECRFACIKKGGPNNTLQNSQNYTTCIPVEINQLIL